MGPHKDPPSFIGNNTKLLFMSNPSKVPSFVVIFVFCNSIHQDSNKCKKIHKIPILACSNIWHVSLVTWLVEELHQRSLPLESSILHSVHCLSPFFFAAYLAWNLNTHTLDADVLFVSPSVRFSLFAFSTWNAQKPNISKVGFGCFSSLDFVQITIIFWGELKKVLNSGMEHITVAVAV